MSTSILYHGFKARGYTYLRAEYKKGAVIFHLKKSKSEQCCAHCGSKSVIKKGKKNRKVKTVPIGTRQVYLCLHLHRLKCKSCGRLRQEASLICLPKKHYTKVLSSFVLELLKKSTVKDVSDQLGMSWGTIKEIHKCSLEKKYGKIKLNKLRYLGVDEIAIRKGHRYMTVVVDLDSGAVVWVEKDRSVSSLEKFLIKLKRSRAPIKAIAMDMWPAYLTAVLNQYSNDVVVFDRYHVIANYNLMLEKLRQQEASKANQKDASVYKGTRYLLLKGREKIEEDQEATGKLERLLELNASLNKAYILKEELRAIWNCQHPQEAYSRLCMWLQLMWSTGINKLHHFASQIAEHFTGIMNFFEHRITTGPVEGINNKIKVLKRQAYGFRDFDYFKLRIHALHNARYSLIG